MLFVRHTNKFLGLSKTGKAEFLESPKQVVRFVNTTSITSYMRENFPLIKRVAVHSESGEPTTSLDL